jgi:CheY-like chemotaxis protein/anti-sigma regulatory factor (Ser/Thr protein kinase)
VKLNLEPLLPAQIVQTVLQMFSSEAIKKKLELKAEIEDENLIIIGDSTRISQVLINLVSNAVKFTSQGRITISIRCEEQKDKLNVTFAVEDTGVGIEMTAQLFNRFEQIPQRTFSDYEGSGLGLFISKHLVEIMGGTIGVKSEKDKGACFTFNILSEKPTNMQINSVKTKNTIHRRVVTPEEVFQNHHVLVCEDNRINQRILVQLVTKAGGTCVAANDGVEGVELFSSDPNITLVFMDVSMPRMDGFEATKKIREIESQSRSKQVAIIGISGNVRQEYYEKGLETGMNDYLYKVRKTALILTFSL